MPRDPSRYTPFAISVAHIHDEVVLAVEGELELASADQLERSVARLQQPEIKRIVLDLSQVQFIDSSGLRVLLAVRNAAKRKGHALVLVAPAPSVQRIFEITGTRGLFDWQSRRP
jgi:anti-sigma B factor antagonist